MPDTPSNSEPTLVLNPVIQTSGIFPSRDGGIGYLAYTLGQIHWLATNYHSNSGIADLNGGLMPISSNTALFSLLGTNFGGNGISTFGLPDLGGRVAAAPDGHTLGEQYGQDVISLTQSNLPPSSGGSSLPGDNVQPSLAVGWYINVFGIYPSPDGGGSPAMLGAINLFAGNFAPNSTMPCDGRLLAIAEFDALFTILGTTYGGDGVSTFALPDLRGRSPVGAGNSYLGTFYEGQAIGNEAFSLTQANMPADMGGSAVPLGNREPGLVLTPLIALQGLFGAFDETSPTLGEITWFAGNFAPRGYAIAQGQLLSINQNQALFSLLGTTFGGDGRTTFQLPDLRGRIAVGDDGSHVLGSSYGSETFSVTDATIPALNILGDGGDNTLYGGPLGDTINGQAGNDTIYGNAGADILVGGLGNDVLDGGVGIDNISGGPGDDVYIVDNGGDVVVELAGEGTDEVRTALSTYWLGANVEHLTGTAMAKQTLVGNELDNVIQGGTGNDVLNGLAGGDETRGGAGNDAYYVSELGDSIVEGAGEGTDIVYTYVNHTLEANVENLTLLVGGRVGTGNDDANTIYGSPGVDTIYGMGGADRIAGGAGNDAIYGGDGMDSLWGDAGNDTIDGGAGADTMIGGTGNDTYYIDDAGDMVIEQPGEGTDEIRTTLLTFTLAPDQENLTGLLTSKQTLIGNDLDNVIQGGAGNDVINGLAGNDAMKGGAGNDAYYVYDAGDTIVELSGEGTDTVYTYASHTLAANVENLTLLNAGNTGTGNDLANTIYGSSGIDTIFGMGGADQIAAGGGIDTIDAGAGDDLVWGGAGNDVIRGGLGFDRLRGEAGADRFVFGEGETSASRASADRLPDFSQAEGDKIDLSLIDANSTGGAPGDQAFAFIGSAAFSNVAGELRFEQSGGFTYVEGDTNGDSIADFSIQLGSVLTPVAADFVL